jgi:hypothetical protein
MMDCVDQVLFHCWLLWLLHFTTTEDVPHQARAGHCCQELFHIHQLLASTLMQYNWDIVDNWSTAQAHLTQMSATSKQKQKLEHLYDTQHPVDIDKVVVNLTDKVLDLAAIAILSRGLNFAQSTNIRSHLKEVISRVEQAIQHLPTEIAEGI